MAKEKEEEIKNVFPLTINEWLWLDHILNAQMRTFEDMNAARLYKIAKDEEWANKSAATAQPSSSFSFAITLSNPFSRLTTGAK